MKILFLTISFLIISCASGPTYAIKHDPKEPVSQSELNPKSNIAVLSYVSLKTFSIEYEILFVKKNYLAEILDPKYYQKLLLDSLKTNANVKVLPYEVLQNSASFKALPPEDKNNQAVHIYNNGIIYYKEDQFKLFPKFAEETKSDALLLLEFSYAFTNNPNSTISEPVEGLITYLTINVFNKSGKLIYSNLHSKTIEIGKPQEDPVDTTISSVADKAVSIYALNFGSKVSKYLEPHLKEQSKLVLETGLQAMSEKLNLKPKKK